MLCRGLLGPQFAPDRVELAYPAPAYADEYRRLFGCEVRFDAPANRVVVDGRWLGMPMPAANPATAQQVLELCHQQMPRLSASSELVAAVEKLVRLQLAEAPRLPRSLVVLAVTPDPGSGLGGALAALKRSGFEVGVVWIRKDDEEPIATGLPEGVPVYPVLTEEDLRQLGAQSL